METPRTERRSARASHFIEEIVEADREAGRHDGRLLLRFPPEPNGYLHVGHAKAICINFGIAEKYGGACNLRFDDTNPTREKTEYIEAIEEDVRWLGFDWGERRFFASDWFGRLYELAQELVRRGKAYVCDLPLAEVRAQRGSPTEPGLESPWRDRSVAESLDLLERMRAGEFEEGTRTLRARIDMASPHLLLRDPVMYRILRVPHHRSGDAWNVYPTYDWAHGQSDALEGVTHSLCSLEFQNHRPLYDWFLDQLGGLDLPSRPRQIEFSRLELTHTVVSKRVLRELVDGGHVSGWDDPRMPTLRGLRRRGVPPEAIRALIDEVGVTKVAGRIDLGLLDHHVRRALNATAQRRMGVLRPLKVVIENFPEDRVEEVEAENNPEDPAAGTRTLPFCREVFVDRDDWRDEAPRKWHRLAPGKEVRLRWAYAITCRDVLRDPASGEPVELRCTYDPETARGATPDGRKIRGILHWVSARHALRAEVRLFEPLFVPEDPSEVAEGGSIADNLNPRSREVLEGCALEPSLAGASLEDRFQFERVGYFCLDPAASAAGAPVFHRIAALRDAWSRIERRDG